MHSCKWSYSSQYLVTAGSSAVNIWSKEHDSAILTLDRLTGNIADVPKGQKGQVCLFPKSFLLCKIV